MKALISNDDGIHATGILAAKKAVEEICDVTVVAPETQQSGIGHLLFMVNVLFLTLELTKTEINQRNS